MYLRPEVCQVPPARKLRAMFDSRKPYLFAPPALTFSGLALALPIPAFSDDPQGDRRLTPPCRPSVQGDNNHGQETTKHAREWCRRICGGWAGSPGPVSASGTTPPPSKAAPRCPHSREGEPRTFHEHGRAADSNRGQNQMIRCDSPGCSCLWAFSGLTCPLTKASLHTWYVSSVLTCPSVVRKSDAWARVLDPVVLRTGASCRSRS